MIRGMLTGAVAKGGRLATLQEQVAVARLNPFNYEYNKTNAVT